jgi:hypothetical protein
MTITRWSFQAQKNEPSDPTSTPGKKAPDMPRLSGPPGEWNEDDFDVLADGTVVGRIFKPTPRP